MAKLHRVTCAMSNEELVAGHILLGALHHIFYACWRVLWIICCTNSFHKPRKKYSLEDPQYFMTQGREWDFACEWRQRRMRILKVLAALRH